MMMHHKQRLSNHQTLSMDQLTLIIQGHAASQLLRAGVELGLFDLLSQRPGLTPAEIKVGLSLEPQPTRILLVGLTALGLLERQDGTLRNSELTEQVMVRGKPGNLADVLGWQFEIVYPGLEDFVDALRENRNVGLRHFQGDGDTLYKRLESDPKKEAVFQKAMSSLSKHANQAFLEHCDLSGYSHIVDVGGGDGTNALNLARKYPHLRVTVFDAPSVCDIASRNIEAAGLTDRVSVWPGNVFDDPFPPGIDAIFYGHFFTIWSPQTNQGILRKSREALPDGGAVMLFNMMGSDNEDGPLSTALGSPYFLTIATGEGMLYAWKDYAAWLVEAGFSETRRIDGLPLNHGVFVGVR